MALFKVINYDSWKVHYATARREDLAQGLPPEEVTADSWFHWKTVCGRELIGHASEDHEVNCLACLKAVERAARTYADLNARLGVED